MHELNTTYQFCHALHAAAANEGELTRAAALMADVNGLTCSAHSQVAEITFLTPFARDMWADTAFRFSRGTFVLRATGSLTAVNAKKALIRSVFQCCIASKR